MEEKSIVRSSVLTLLKGLESDWLEAAGMRLVSGINELIESRFPDIEAVLAWASFFPGEPELRPLIDAQLPLRAVYLPRSLEDYTLQFLRAGPDWKDELVKGIHGIPEPREGSGAEFKNKSEGKGMILVPALAFDKAGNRLGRGKGYYDRFLSKSENSTLIKVGVCWSMQVLESVENLLHDIPVDYVCTETEILEI